MTKTKVVKDDPLKGFEEAILVLGKEKFDLLQQTFGKDPAFGDIIQIFVKVAKRFGPIQIGSGSELLPKTTPVIPGISGKGSVLETKVGKPI